MENFTSLNNKLLILSVLYEDILTVDISSFIFFKSPSIRLLQLIVNWGRVASSQQAPFNRLYKKNNKGFHCRTLCNISVLWSLSVAYELNRYASTVERRGRIIRPRPACSGTFPRRVCFKRLQMLVAAGAAQRPKSSTYEEVFGLQTRWKVDLREMCRSDFGSGGQTTAKLDSFLLIYFTGKCKACLFWSVGLGSLGCT